MAELYDAADEITYDVSDHWRKWANRVGVHPVWGALGEEFENANHHGAWNDLVDRYQNIESWIEKIEREIRADERDTIMERATGG